MLLTVHPILFIRRDWNPGPLVSQLRPKTTRPAGCHIVIHTYHLRLIPEGLAEVSQIFLKDTYLLPILVSYEEHGRRDRW
jgi:hypothetical protein